MISAKFAIYAVASILATYYVVEHAMATREYTYSALVYLASSKLSIVVVGHTAIVLGIIIARIIKSVFLGQLKPNEVERANEILRYTIPEVILGITFFHESLSVRSVILFLLALTSKFFHIVVDERVKFFEGVQGQNISKWQHLRLLSFVFVLFGSNLLAVSLFYLILTHQGPSVIILFLYISGIQLLDLIKVTYRMVLLQYSNRYRLRTGNDWRNRNLFMMYGNALVSLLKICATFVYLSTVMKYYQFPYLMVTDLFHALREFYLEFTNIRETHNVRHNISKLPSPTVNDIERTGVMCVVCHDDLVPGADENPGILQQNIPLVRESLLKAKKLSCGHVFHTECLLSWWERQRTCPMCRADVNDVLTGLNNAANNANVDNNANVNLAQDANQANNNANANNNQEDHNRLPEGVQAELLQAFFRDLMEANGGVPREENAEPAEPAPEVPEAAAPSSGDTNASAEADTTGGTAGARLPAHVYRFMSRRVPSSSAVGMENATKTDESSPISSSTSHPSGDHFPPMIDGEEAEASRSASEMRGEEEENPLLRRAAATRSSLLSRIPLPSTPVSSAAASAPSPAPVSSDSSSTGRVQSAAGVALETGSVPAVNPIEHISLATESKDVGHAESTADSEKRKAEKEERKRKKEARRLLKEKSNASPFGISSPIPSSHSLSGYSPWFPGSPPMNPYMHMYNPYILPPMMSHPNFSPSAFPNFGQIPYGAQSPYSSTASTAAGNLANIHQLLNAVTHLQHQVSNLQHVVATQNSARGTPATANATSRSTSGADSTMTPKGTEDLSLNRRLNFQNNNST